MNFLLHRHLAARDTGDAVAGLGAMLPDLWRMAHRRVRPRPVETRPEDLTAPLRELQLGIEHHLEADAWFHRHPVFIEGEQSLNEAFGAVGLRAPKIGLFAHPLWELAIDGALVARQGTETIVAALGQVRRKAPADLMLELARLHAPAVLRDETTHAFSARLEDLLDRLEEGSWIAGYCNGPGLAARLEGIRRRIGLAPLEHRDRQLLANAAGDALARAPAALDALLAVKPPASAWPDAD